MIITDIKKPYNIKFKKGSALILSVLLLAFFTVMSLNIYYFGRKKSESTTDKIFGEKVSNYIDIASSIGYQELYIAENFVKKGAVYDNSHPASEDNYSQPSSSKSYLKSDGTFSEKYSGIQLNRFSQYFDSYWDYKLEDEDGKNTKDSQKIILTENIDNSKVQSRTWQSGGVPRKAFKLWEITGTEDTEMQVSIGGYRLTNVFLTNLSDSESEKEISLKKDVKNSIEAELETNKNYLMRAVFEKTIKIDEFVQDKEVEIPEIKFNIQVEENIEFNTEDGTDLGDEVFFYEDEISIDIEKSD
jgi:hypothetical protein